nr:immunoglobulin light chain junction region [Macaca mulatta]
GSLFYNVAWVF